MAAKKWRSPKTVKKAITKRFVDDLLKDLGRTKARVKELRKLRDQVVITVSDPRGAILMTLTMPGFVYDKHSAAIDALKEELPLRHNQYLEVHTGEDLIQCSTLEDLQAEINSLNEIDDQKEEDGVEG